MECKTLNLLRDHFNLKTVSKMGRVVWNVNPRTFRRCINWVCQVDSKKAEYFFFMFLPGDYLSCVVGMINAQRAFETEIDRATMAICDLREFLCNQGNLLL